MRMKITAVAVAVLALLCLSSPAQAQNLTTISADNIQDVSGRNLAAGQLCFQATDELNRVMSFRAGGGGQVITTPFCTPVVNGAVTNFSVPNPDETAPANIRYRVTVTPRPARPGAANNLLTYTGVYLCDIVGACDSPFTFDLDLYIPRETPIPVIGIPSPGPAGPAGATGATGAAGANGAISTILDDGSAETVRPGLNLISGTNSTVNCVDNAGATRTDCTIASTGGAAPGGTDGDVQTKSGSSLSGGTKISDLVNKNGPAPFYRDVTSSTFGGCIYSAAFPLYQPQGTITSGTATMHIDRADSIWNMPNGCGVFVYGAGSTVTVAAPAFNASSGAWAGGSTYAIGDTVTHGGNTFRSRVNGNIGINPLTDHNTLAANWFPLAMQKGSCQETSNASPTQGVCGTTTYTYRVASRSPTGGFSAASQEFTVTAAAAMPSTEVVITHADWLPTVSYSIGNFVRFLGQIYLSKSNTNQGNRPYQNPTHWGAVLDNYNYVWLSGPLVAGARGYTIWKKVGAGAYSCITDTYVQNDTGDGMWHYEDHGQLYSCDPYFPGNTPPDVAGKEPLITTLVSGAGTQEWVLANNAVTSVTNASVWPDNSAAMDAALLQINADALSVGGGSAQGAPCLLIPAGGYFYLSRFDPLYAIGGAANSRTKHICAAGTPVMYSMPFFVNLPNMDIEGYSGGGEGSGTTPIAFNNATGFVVADLSGNPGSPGGSADYTHIHGFQAASKAPQLILTGNAVSLVKFDALRFQATALNPNVLVGGNLITWAMSDFKFDSALAASDYGQESIVISLQAGGTTNTFQIGSSQADSEIVGSGALLVRSPWTSPTLGYCAIQQMKIENVITESSVSTGYINGDQTYVPWLEGCAVNQSSVVQGGALDPRVGVAHMYSAGAAFAGTIDFQGFLQSGPIYASGIPSTSPQTSGGAVYINSAMPSGAGNWGTDAPIANIGVGWLETNGVVNAFQNPSSSTGTGFRYMAQRPYISALTTQAGGSFAAGTYFYYATLCTKAGLTDCTPTSLTLGGPTTLGTYLQHFITTPLNNENLVTISHTYPTTPCDHYNVWRGTVSNEQNTYFTVACPSGLAGSVVFTDEGTAGTAGTRPTVNAASLFSVGITGDVTVPTEVYDATNWNGDLTIPTKDAVRDKIEAMGGDFNASSSLSVTAIAVGSLPAAAGGNAGQWRTVNDSTTIAVPGQTCVGGGGGPTAAAAFSNGTVWKCF